MKKSNALDSVQVGMWSKKKRIIKQSNYEYICCMNIDIIS